jgi:guanylate kinase
MPPTSTTDLSAALQSNRPIVISGPSGAGKSTILNRLFTEYPDRFGFSVSHTTRQPRAGEQNGREYHFVTHDEFEDLVQKKGFVEHAQFGGNRYGTSIQAIRDIAEKGRICILDIEMEVCVYNTSFLLLLPFPALFTLASMSEVVGQTDRHFTDNRGKGVKQVANHPTFPQPRFLFLSPPSPEILEQRLRSRATDSEEAIQKRLNQAVVEMEFARSPEAPHEKIVVNNDLEKAYLEVKAFVVGE